MSPFSSSSQALTIKVDKKSNILHTKPLNAITFALGQQKTKEKLLDEFDAAFATRHRGGADFCADLKF
jgi:hypothetical protein